MASVSFSSTKDRFLVYRNITVQNALNEATAALTTYICGASCAFQNSSGVLKEESQEKIL